MVQRRIQQIQQQCRYLLLVGLVLGSVFLSGCGVARDMSPTVWDLTPDAQVSYAALLLDQSMRSDSTEGVYEAAKIFLQYAPLSRPLSDAAAWLLLSKKPLMAQDILQKAVKILPNDLTLHVLLAELLLEEGYPEQAITLFKQFLPNSLNQRHAQQEYGIVLLKAKQFAAADAVFRRLETDVSRPYMLYYHAQALFALEQLHDAVYNLEKLLVMVPDFHEARFLYAQALEELGNIQKARQQFMLLLEELPENNDILLHAMNMEVQATEPQKALALLQKYPSSIGSVLSITALFIEKKYYSEALSALETLSFQDPRPPEYLLYRAVIAFEYEEDLDHAIALSKEITQESALYEQALRFRIQMHFLQGDMKATQDTILTALSFFPTDSEFLLLQAQVHIIQKEWYLAKLAFEQALALYPDDTELLFHYGSVLDMLNCKNTAFHVMEQILLLDPTDYQALNYVGYSLAAMPGYERTTKDTMIGQACQPQQRFISETQAQIDLLRALDLLYEANELAPDNAYIIDSLAWAEYRSGKLDAAWEHIKMAVALPDSEAAEIWEHYGDIAHAVGEHQQARNGWQRALSLSPENKNVLQKKLDALKHTTSGEKP